MSKKAPPEFGDESGPSLHSARWRFGEFELDETRRELRLRGELLKIEAKPLNLLMLLLRHPGEMITKNDLIDALWTGRIVTEAVLGNCVAKLRQVLGDDGAALIKTVFGFGYRFDVEAQLLSDDAVTIAPPKLAFQPGDSPPMRPNWKLIRRLGRSGDCWLAEHTKTRAQRVFKFTTELHGLSALKREVTVYRLLHESLGDKACYVDLLDWNFDEPPWFVEAEYCAAGSLQEWFTARGGVERIPLSARLELIAQIAEALAEIHAVGVLHKDLKPANVFVVLDNDGRPTIRLADFGSSRLYDSEYLARLQITKLGFTQMLDPNQGESSGTPLYLAPEVVAGQPATVKADIYALGVMLYQFVTGNLSRRLEAGWEAAVDDEILREDINAAADGDPQRRLADPRELARKLRAIEARRQARKAEHVAKEKAERAARALERIKARRVGLMAAFAALTIGFVVSAWLYVDARKAREIAEAETRRAEKVADFLGEDMFKAVNTDEHPVKDLTVKELLDAAAAAVKPSLGADPETAAKVYEALGHSYEALELIPEAGNNLDQALAIRQALPKPAIEDVLRITTDLVDLKYPVGQLAAHISDYQRIYDQGRHELGGGDSKVIKLRLALARGRIQLGDFEAGAKELVEMRTAMADNRASDKDTFTATRNALARVLIELGRSVEAEPILLEALKEAIERRGAEHLEVGMIKVRLSRVYYESGRFQQSEAMLNDAESIAQKWNVVGGGLETNVRLYRSWLRYYQRRYTEAVQILEKIKVDVAERDTIDLDQSFTEDRPLGLSYQAIGLKEKAIATLERGLASATRSLGPDHPWTLQLQQDYLAASHSEPTKTAASP
ncbi:protein kinase domain-containing protein [Nevskia ramosa]|uniref:protein kinase domain-containing protein n=1 Tax=Nevskia ramosa TaxID=64002 RepID=UPI003D1327FB